MLLSLFIKSQIGIWALWNGKERTFDSFLSSKLLVILLVKFLLEFSQAVVASNSQVLQRWRMENGRRVILCNWISLSMFALLSRVLLGNLISLCGCALREDLTLLTTLWQIVTSWNEVANRLSTPSSYFFYKGKNRGPRRHLAKISRKLKNGSQDRIVV